jgi:hypothetical protein
MAWFKKKPDPISDRARALNEQIAQLESEIRRLGTEVQDASPARPSVGGYSPRNNPSVSPKPASGAPEPIFEDIKPGLLKSKPDAMTPAHFNELGVRKYDLPALWQRLRNHFRGPSATNPKLVSYLAAGGIQGLRPLRYEKRVARNRFIFLVLGLFLMLMGLIWIFMRNSP